MKASKMAKKALALLIALTMVLSVIPLTAGAEEANAHPSPCSGDHSTWTAFDGTTQIQESGFYCLTKDMGTVTVAPKSAVDVTICLNGHTVAEISGDGQYATINVCDCSGNGRIHGTGINDYGRGISGKTVNLYDVTVSGFQIGISAFEVNLYDGSVITDCRFAVGGLVLGLCGGTITGNNYVDSGLEYLTLEKGVIADNFVDTDSDWQSTIYANIALTGTDVQVNTPLRAYGNYDYIIATVRPDPDLTSIVYEVPGYAVSTVAVADGEFSLEGTQYCFRPYDSDSYVYYDSDNGTVRGGVLDIVSLPSPKDPTFALSAPMEPIYQWYHVVDGEGEIMPYETEATLNAPVMYETYYCEAYFPDLVLATDKGIQSNPVTMNPVLTQYPVPSDLTVGTNFADDVASYQWYEAENSLTEITEESGVDHIGNEYDPENGWMLWGSDDMSDDFWVALSLDGLTAGENLYITTTKPVDSISLVHFDDNSGATYLEHWYAENAPKTEWVIPVPYTGYYYLGFGAAGIEEDVTMGYMRVYHVSDVILGEPVAGETSATLKNPAIGKSYSCRVTYENGETLTSPAYEIRNAITQQPTVADPSVEVLFPAGVTYQWYKADTKVATITDAHADGEFPIGTATYDEVNGWTGIVDDDTAYFFHMPMKAGDVITVESDAIGAIALTSEYYGSEMNEVYDMDGADGWSVTVPADDTYMLIAMATAETVTAHITGSITEWKPLDGETGAALKNPEVGAKYFCRVTYADETVEDSNTIELAYDFVKQPTAADPSVEVSFEKDVVSYQWYETSGDVFEITDEEAIADFTEMGLARSSTYDPTTGWTGVYPDGSTGFVFIVDLKEGDILSIEASDDVLEATMLADITTFGQTHQAYGEKVGNAWLMTAPADDTYFLAILDPTEAVTIRAYLGGSGEDLLGAALEGQNSPVLSVAPAGSYLCAVTYEDGTVLYSDVVTLENALFGASFVGASVDVGYDLSIRYYADLSSVDLEDGQRVVVDFTRNGKTVRAEADDVGAQTFTYYGLSPQCMTDLIDAKLLVVDAEGNTVRTLAVKNGYSVRENVKNLLADTRDEFLTQFLSDLLRYGEKAQVFVDYKTDDLATDGVEGLASVKDAMPEMSDKNMSIFNSGAAAFDSVSVVFDSANRIRVKFHAVDVSGVTLRFFGEEFDSEDFTSLGNDLYFVETDNILATEMQNVFLFELYENGNLLQNLSYSIRSYVLSMEERGSQEMKDLAWALYRYGESARQYMESQMY